MGKRAIFRTSRFSAAEWICLLAFGNRNNYRKHKNQSPGWVRGIERWLWADCKPRKYSVLGSWSFRAACIANDNLIRQLSLTSVWTKVEICKTHARTHTHTVFIVFLTSRWKIAVNNLPIHVVLCHITKLCQYWSNLKKIFFANSELNNYPQLAAE